MALTTAQIQQAYVTFFSRPADPVGLAYWQNYSGSEADLYATFAQQSEYAAAFSGLTSAQKVNVVYQNLFGRDAEQSGLLYWAALVEGGQITVANLARAVSAGSQGADATVVSSRVAAATSFTTALDTPAEVLGYTGTAANAAAKTWLSSVKTAADLTAAVTTASLNTATAGVIAVGGAPGSAYTLTVNAETFTGTSGNDSFNAILGTGATLNSFDVLAGGSGTDTLNIADGSTAAFAMPSSLTLSGFETVNLGRSGATGANDVTVTNTTFGTGVQTLNVANAGANTTGPVDITLASATAVNVASTGTAFTTVAITDTSTTAASTGSTLKTASIAKATGAATLTGNGITTVNLEAVGGLTTVTAAAGARALTINASGTTTQGGLTDAQATSATLNVSGAQTFGTLTVAKATSVAVNATAQVTETLAAAVATSLTLGGTKLNTLTVTNTDPIATITVSGAGGVSSDVSGLTALTSLDTSGSTAATVAGSTTVGPNTFTISTTTAYTGGAGQDVVTVGATGKAVNLGAGNDKAVVSVTALAAGGAINGGDGTDTLKLSNANAVTLSTANAVTTAFKAAVTGFETLDITTQTGSTVDISKMGTFTGVTMVSANATQVVNGVASGNTVESVYGAAGGTVTTNLLTGAADVLNITLKGDLSGGARAFGTFETPGIETVNIVTNDTTLPTTTAQKATITLTDANATSINISGNNGVALTHTGTALTSFDATGVTKGGVSFTAGVLTTDAVAKGSTIGGDTLDFNQATAKVTVTAVAGTNTLKGSSTIASTINGGTGADTITGGSGIDTITAGAGSTANTITGAAAADKIDLTGSTGVDTLIFGVASTSVSATGANVDTITNFTSGVDKIQLTAGDNSNSTTTVSAGGLAGINLAAGSTLATMLAVVSDTTAVETIADVYTRLALDLNNTTNLFAASATGAGNVVGRQVTFSTGAAAGTYLVINDVTAAFQAATDVVIKLAGTTTFAATDLTVV